MGKARVRCLAALILAAPLPAAAQSAVAPGAAPARSPALARFDAAVVKAKTAMMADPASAMGPVRQAGTLAALLPPDRDAKIAMATVKWLEGEALSRVNKSDQSLPILANALSIGSEAAPGSKLVADILLAKGTAEAAIGRVSPALADLQRAYALHVRLGNARDEAKALLIIGGIYSDAGDSAHSLQYYAMVPEIYRGDPAIDLAAHNNLGETLKKLGRYQEAEAQFRAALAAAKLQNSHSLAARILPNLASTQLLRGHLAEADATAEQGLYMARTPDAAGWRPFIWGVRAQIALARSDLSAARDYLKHTFAGVDLERSPLPFRDFHQTAYETFDRLGDAPLALRHLKAFKRLDDETNQLTASTNAALMTARFDFANQNLRIEKFKAGDIRQKSLLVQSKARLHTIVLLILLAAGTVLMGVLLVGFIALARSRNRVRAANADLQRANVSLEEALKVKTEFLATTSHEIRTPLNGILGMTQVLLANTRLDKDTRERLTIVNGAGETMKALVDDILDIAKIETGNLSLHRGPLDLPALLRDASGLWRDQAEAKGLRFVVELDDCAGWIEEDEARLRQIIFNLLSNALKFTEAGEVGLSARAVDHADGKRILVAVRDSGVGIAEDQQAIIFESFRQVDGGKSRRYGGTGLGLAICRNLALAMGGDLTVASRPGEGSTFTLSLPMRPAAGAQQSEAALQVRLEAGTLGEAALLLLHTNPLGRRVMAKVLMAQVGKLVPLGDVAETLALLGGGRPPDHLVIDADSLGEPGDERIAAIRTLVDAARAANVRVSILITPVSGCELRAVILASAAQLIIKPLSGNALGEALRTGYSRPVPDVLDRSETAAA